MGVQCPNSDNKLNIFESGEEGTLDYRLRFAMEEHAHRCIRKRTYSSTELCRRSVFMISGKGTANCGLSLE